MASLELTWGKSCNDKEEREDWFLAGGTGGETEHVRGGGRGGGGGEGELGNTNGGEGDAIIPLVERENGKSKMMYLEI